MCLSASALGGQLAVQTLQLSVQLSGKQLLFLVDSGSTNSFLDATLASVLPGVIPLLAPIQVRVANGAVISCTQQIPDCVWWSAGYKFQNHFKILPLGNYDGILGLDWLSSHSPMQVDWLQKWI